MTFFNILKGNVRCYRRAKGFANNLLFTKLSNNLR